MNNEYFDIVDENNILTGEKRLRKEVHSSGLWHRAVHIYYCHYQHNNYYFLVHLRSKLKDLNPNTWDTRFGGHLNSGDDVNKTLLKELEEEIGIKANLKDFIPGPIYKREKYPNNEFVYVFYYQGDKNISHLNFQDDEVQAVKWLSADEIITNLKETPNEWSSSVRTFTHVLNFLKNNNNQLLKH